MRDAGIRSGDILIVDRAVEPINNCVVIARLNEELIVSADVSSTDFAPEEALLSTETVREVFSSDSFKVSSSCTLADTD